MIIHIKNHVNRTNNFIIEWIPWHVLHAVGTVVTVNLVGDTEPAPYVQTVPAEVEFGDWLEGAAATLVPHHLHHRHVKRGVDG